MQSVPASSGKRQRVGLGLLGCGTVGSGVVELLHAGATGLAQRVGASLELVRVLVRDAAKVRSDDCPRALLTTRPDEVLADPRVDVVIEVMGGEQEAFEYIVGALDAGKSVVSANKLLLARRGDVLLERAVAAGVDLAFEGAVGGGIPIVRTLREALVSDRVTALVGILNGTCNFVLSRMLDQGDSLMAAVAEAQRLGYAEADASIDLGGQDAAHKLCILARLAFGAAVREQQVHTEGIEGIEPIDHHVAERFGYRIKHLVIGRDHGDELELRTHPALVPARSVLANVSGVLNAALLEGAALGPCLVYGRGAGARPTAVSVVSDVVAVARDIVAGVAGLQTRGIRAAERPVRALGDVESRFYVRFTVRDEPGVMAVLASSLGRAGVSIEQLVQDGLTRGHGAPASVVMLTHRAREAAVRAALADLRSAPAMVEPPRLIRIEET